MKDLVMIALLLVHSGAGAQIEPAPPAERAASTTFAVLGSAIGAPSSIVLVGGVYAGSFSLKVSGGAWSREWRGIQIGLGIPFSHSGALVQEVSVVAGSYSAAPILTDPGAAAAATPRHERYLGVVYDALYSGFFLQAGLGAGRGDENSLQPLMQFGYLITLP